MRFRTKHAFAAMHYVRTVETYSLSDVNEIKRSLHGILLNTRIGTDIITHDDTTVYLTKTKPEDDTTPTAAFATLTVTPNPSTIIPTHSPFKPITPTKPFTITIDLIIPFECSLKELRAYEALDEAFNHIIVPTPTPTHDTEQEVL